MKMYFKLKRILKETIGAVLLYENFLIYYGERLKIFRNRSVSIKLRNGIKYKIKARTNEISIINEIWGLKIYNRLMSSIEDGSTVVDIGANIGVFSVKAARYKKDIRVLSFEPMQGNYEALKENIRINNLENFIVPYKIAVSGNGEDKVLYFKDKDSGGASIHNYRNEAVSQIRVPSITLESIFKDHAIKQCDFLKIDCEGAEGEIILNTPRSLFSHIKSMTIEWHEGLNSITLKEFRKFLEDLGYISIFDNNTITLYVSQS